jgi:peptidoglycan/LPS O-acetylase OafA/YrhL
MRVSLLDVAQEASRPRGSVGLALDRPGTPSPGAGGRVPELDGIRGLAILLVVAWHYFGGMFPAAPGTWGAYLHVPFRLGWTGVDCFFVLSGFLIGGILLDSRRSPRYFRTFYARRFYRILPLWFAVLTLFESAVVMNRCWGYFAGSVLVQQPCPIWSYLSFTHNWWMVFVPPGSQGRAANGVGVSWSLAIEEQFYLTLPLLIWILPRQVLLYLVPALVMAAPIFRQILARTGALPGGETDNYFLSPCRQDALYLGVWAALLVRTPRVWQWLRDRPRLVRLALAASALGMAAVTWGKPGWLFHNNYTLIGLFYFCLLLAILSRPSGRLAELARTGWLRQLGVLCYGLYLLHLPVQILCHRWLLGRDGDFPCITDLASAGATLLALAVTLLLVKGSWNYFEKPLIGRGHAWNY